ncbi:universal stress protein [uncultured Chitinophaga sp.]|uniref:universal stress protein n=1 Tax=uncultured Chitinophaga sp. TaxID=339340 RepID=UPI0026045C89|nr:universal stress protein [uncultured Chitinophaga sp.]
MRTILVCTDFSASADHAMEYACMLATRFNFPRIALYHAYQVMAPTTDLPVTPYVGTELYNAVERKLNELAAKVKERTGPDVVVDTRGEERMMDENINEICKQEDAQLIVTGVSEKSGLERMIVGSTALRISEVGQCPVLMVPPDAPVIPPQRILLACDLEKVSEATPLDALDKVLETFQARLVVINVDDGNHRFSPKTTTEIYSLHHIFDKYKPEYVFVENKDIGEGIMDYAKEHDISLLITIPRYFNFLRNLFRKSTTRHLVYNAKLPLLTVHE